MIKRIRNLILIFVLMVTNINIPSVNAQERFQRDLGDIPNVTRSSGALEVDRSVGWTTGGVLMGHEGLFKINGEVVYD